VSGITAWLTLFRRGAVKMTRPTVIYFGPDSPKSRALSPKVFLRTLLFSTSKRGRVVENMFVTLTQNGEKRRFNVWAYGERGELVRGSGLFVGETGVEANHHFLASDPQWFGAGEYRLDVFIQVLGDRSSKLLFSQTLTISTELAEKLEQSRLGIYFDWFPDTGEYVPHIDERDPSPDGDQLAKLMSALRS
jgi:hypothetical protein